MSRSLPARVQSFFQEQNEKEVRSRLKFNEDKKNAGAYSENGIPLELEKELDTIRRLYGVTTFNPLAFAIKQKREEIDRKAKISQEVTDLLESKSISNDEETRSRLYEGVSKEEKGRYDYLRARYKLPPYEKYDQPMLTSWQHGWRTN